MRRRALLRAAGVGAGSLALPGVGQSVLARRPASTESTGFQEVSRWSPLDAGGWDAVHPALRTLHDLYVQGSYAYCAYWDAGTFIVDVSEPSSPSLVSHVGEYSRQELIEVTNDEDRLRAEYGEAPGNAHYVMVDDEETVMAVGAEGWDNPDTDVRGVGGIDLYDLSDIEAPEKVGRIDPPEADDETRRGTWVTSHNFDIAGDRLYTSWYQAGVKIHDISDPANPEQLAWWRQPEEATFWTAKVAKPGEFFVATSYGAGAGTPGLYTFPDEAGEQPDPPSLTDDESGDGRVRASGAAAPRQAAYEPTGFVEIQGASEAVVGDDGETAYVATGDGFAVVDVSDPAEPSVITERRNLLADRENGPLQSILDVKVDGDTLVVPGPAQRGRLRGFLVYDVSDPENPEQQGQFYETRHSNHNSFLLDDHVYLTGNDGQGNPMVVVDISNPSRSTTTTSTKTTSEETTTTTTEETTTTTTISEGGDESTTTTTDAQETPGFGIGAAVGGLGLGALGLRRYLADDEE